MICSTNADLMDLIPKSTMAILKKYYRGKKQSYAYKEIAKYSVCCESSHSDTADDEFNRCRVK